MRPSAFPDYGRNIKPEMWTFDQPPNAAAIVSRSIVMDGRPILFVVHVEDDHGWQFLEGFLHYSEPLVLAMREAVDLDSSVLALADLPPGWCAWRESARHSWSREQLKVLDE